MHVFKVVLVIVMVVLVIGSVGAEDIKMVLQAGNTGAPFKVEFSPDNRLFATINNMGNDIRIWSVTGRLVALLTNDRAVGLAQMCFSADNKYFAVTDDASIKIWNIRTRKMVVISNNEEGCPNRRYTSVAFAPDNEHVIAGVSMNVCLNLPLEPDKAFMDKLLRKVSGNDKKRIEEAYYFDESTNRYVLRLDLDAYSHLYTIFALAGFNDTYISGAQFKQRVELWSVEGTLVKNIHTYSTDMMKTISYVRVLPDKTTLLVYGADNMIKLINMDSGFVMNSFAADNPMNVLSIRFAQAGNLIGWTTYSGYKVCNTSGIFFKNVAQQMVPYDLNLDKQFYVEYGNKVISQNEFYPIVYIKDFDGKVIRETGRLSSTPLIGKISNDGKYVVMGIMDGSAVLINVKNAEMVSLISDMNGQWLAYTHDGYWDASVNGGNLAAMVKGMEAFGLDQFAFKYNRPDIILKRLDAVDDATIEYYHRLYQKRLRKSGLDEESVVKGTLHIPKAAIVSTRQKDKIAEVSFNLNDDSFPLKSYNVYVNDVPLFGALGKTLSGRREVNITEKVELTPGQNKIEVSCINENGAESYRAMTMVNYGKTAKGDLYFIGFGVSDYMDKEISDLQYAHKDVKDLSAMFNGMKKSYGKVYVHSFINKDVTRESISKAKALLDKAGVDDTLVLFIAGHGVHDTDPDSTYYYITQNAKLSNLKDTACDFDLVESILQGVAPRNKLFLMDTCESGELDDEEVLREYSDIAGTRNLNMRGLKRDKKSKKKKSRIKPMMIEKDRYIYNDLLRRSGAIVISSSKGNEYSYENAEYENGLFTEEILNAFIKKAADDDGNNKISVDELKSYIPKAVGELSHDLQHPTVDRDNIFQKFMFPTVK